ncbi:Glycosyl hydrolases family 2, sugar binding domain [compost metagenome]
MRILLATLAICVIFTSHAVANIRIPKIFTTGMVLQEGRENPIWGWADEGESIEITFAGKNIRAKAGKDGKWKAALPVMPYGGPHTLLLVGKNTIELKDILIGEVWFCSGQSNMEMSVANALNAKEEVSLANYPEIRMFTVPHAVSQTPNEDVEKGQWLKCSPAVIARFSAVGYYFGRDLHQKLNVPIGLVLSAWGGTVAESWTSPETIQQDPDFKDRLAKLSSYTPESYKTEKLLQIQKMTGTDFPVKDEGLVNEVAVYAKNDFDDTAWKNIPIPGFWEAKGFYGLDGIAWYRKELILSKNDIAGDMEIHLGRVENSDIAWINGVRLEAAGTNKNRVYTIAANLLKEGENVFSVRVKNDQGSGGIVGGAEGKIYLKTKSERKDISEDWKFKMSEVFDGVLSLKNVGPNDFPTLLFNGMVNPIVNYGIKGVIWYQGENNAPRAKQYHRIFPNLIADWRSKWGQGDFPFLFVSLANYKKPETKPTPSTWAELREAQASALKLPNTGMALAIDLGEVNDIHPKNKQDVGKRLAANALKVAYNKDVIASGPTYKEMSVNGNVVKVSFSNISKGLKSKDGGNSITGFSLAGEDKKFYFAKAELQKDNTILISTDDVKNPVAIRYAWADNPGELNLYNTEDLPATPFRTDTWPGVTK